MTNDHTARPAMVGIDATLDDFFRRAALRRPYAIALVDPANRESFTDGAPRRLTYLQADRIISAIATTLRSAGLSRGAVVAVQLPNTCEAVLILLGIMRAGLIAAPLPLLWRRADAIAALARTSVRAWVGCTRINGTDHASLALSIASELFSIRHVFGFGSGQPEGITPLDDVFAGDMTTPPPDETADASRPADAALITFDVTADGTLPVWRSHAQLLAGGLAAALEGRVERNAVLVSTLALSSFAGISLALVPWLVCGGTLVLHHPFAPECLAAQLEKESCEIAILPAPMLAPMTEAGSFFATRSLRTLIAVHREPQRLAASMPWRSNGVSLMDVTVFGETGLICMHRSDATPRPLPLGPVETPSGTSGGVALIETARLANGHIGLRGPMAPRMNTGLAKVEETGGAFIDTGYPCHVPDNTETMTIGAPSAGLVSIGGYRFAQRDLDELMAKLEMDGTIAAFPDTLSGQRLAGDAPDRAALRQALELIGVNPLIVRAFRERGSVSPV